MKQTKTAKKGIGLQLVGALSDPDTMALRPACKASKVTVVCSSVSALNIPRLKQPAMSDHPAVSAFLAVSALDGYISLFSSISFVRLYQPL